MAQRFGDHLAKLFDAAIDANAHGEKYRWELCPLPNPTGAPAYWFALSCRGALLGTTVSCATPIPNADVDEEQIGALVRQAMEILAAERMKGLKETPAQAGPVITKSG